MPKKQNPEKTRFKNKPMCNVGDDGSTNRVVSFTGNKSR